MENKQCFRCMILNENVKNNEININSCASKVFIIIGKVLYYSSLDKQQETDIWNDALQDLWHFY